MKIKSLIILTLILLLSLFFPHSMQAESTSQNDIETARDKGQEWLNQVVVNNPELTYWVEGTLSPPETYYDLNGNVVAYLFGIETKEGCQQQFIHTLKLSGY
jgi:hypothetical protein